jgi:hypothetical protein
MGYGLDDPGSISSSERFFHRVQIESEVKPTVYKMDTGGSFTVG